MIVNGSGQRVYISGPMRGKPEGNRRAFLSAEENWSINGWRVISPREATERLGWSLEDGSDGERLREVGIIDTHKVLSCDALALLFEWDKSVGCTMELALAHFAGIPVYCAITGELLNLIKTPWKLANKLPDVLADKAEDVIQKFG